MADPHRTVRPAVVATYRHGCRPAGPKGRCIATLNDELREQRLRNLHSSFLKASDEYPNFCHVACYSESPAWRDALRGQHVECTDFPDPKTREGKGHFTEMGRLNREIWSRATRLVNLVYSRIEYLDRPETDFGYYQPHNFQFQSRTWFGLWSEDDDDTALSYALPEFERLAREAAYDFCGCPADGNQWLGLLYETLEPNRRSSVAKRFHPGSNIDTAWLPANVFSASARAIEMLIGRKPLEILLPRSAPIDLPLDNSASLSHPGDEKRPAYERDHLWLKWREEESLTPAKIRNRWDGMTDEGRKAACPTACERVGDASKKAGRDVVVKGLKKARAEKAIRHSPCGQPEER